MSKSILVIGSIGVDGAEKCLDWGESIYLGQYDLVIFNPLSLDRSKLETIIAKDRDYFARIRNQIVESQQKGDTQFVSIIARPLSIKFLGHNVANYDWAPIAPSFEEAPGTKVTKRNVDNDYTKKISTWERLFSEGRQNMPSGGSVGMTLTPLVVNKLDRAIAFGIAWSIQDERGRLVSVAKKSMLFLPAITSDVSADIGLLVKVYGENDKIEDQPEYVKDIKTEGEQDLINNIKLLDGEMGALLNKKEQFKISLDKLQEFKKLLWGNKKSLEDVVHDVFGEFGIQLEKPKIDNIEDRYFLETGDEKIYIEIRGTDNRAMNESDDLAQIIRRIADRPISKKYKARGIFIFNHYRNKKPNERPVAFNSNLIKQAQAFNLCLITGTDLFELVNRKFKGEDVAWVKEKVLNTVGQFTISGQ